MTFFKIFSNEKELFKNPEFRNKAGTTAGITGIILNMLLCIFKVLAGILSSSLSITADALNNLSDAASSIITLIGFKLSKRPACKEHPFGHGRFEYLSAVLVSGIIILMGFELFKSSIGEIFNPSGTTNFSLVAFVILIVSVLVKAFMYFFYKSLGRKIDSKSLIATAKDSLSDCAGTGVVFTGMIVSHFFSVDIDAYIGVLVSGFIIYTGVMSIKDSLSPLLGEPPSKELVKDIESVVMSFDDICGIHDLIIHNYGPSNYIITLHAEVPAKGNMCALHDTIDLIERELQNKLGCIASIHMDPVENDNPEVIELKNFATDVIKSFDKDFSLHDFRVVKGPTHTNLIFDLIIPHSYKLSPEDAGELVANAIHNKNESYFAVIQVERSYI